MTRITNLITLAAVLVLLGATPSDAETKSWDGGAGTNSWQHDRNWLPNGEPETWDDVTIDGDYQVFVNDTTYVIRTLDLDNGAQLYANGYQLMVSTLDGAGVTTITGAGSLLTVQPGDFYWDFYTDTLNLTGGPGSGLNIDGGIVKVIKDVVVDNDATIWSHQDYGHPRLICWGTLSLGGNSLLDVHDALTLDAEGKGEFDLDGADADNEIRVNSDSRLVVDGPIVDDFDGLLVVQDGGSIRFEEPWTVGGTSVGGTVRLAPGPYPEDTVVLEGAACTLEGTLDVVQGVARIDAPVTFGGTSTIAMGDEAALVDPQLVLNDQTTYLGPSFSHDGYGETMVIQNGESVVNASTTISVDTYDWDGEDGTTPTSVAPYQTLTLAVDAIEQDTGMLIDGYNGTCSLLSGHLDVQTPSSWRMMGTLRLMNTVGTAPSVSGSKMIVGFGVSTGTVEVTGGPADLNCGVSFTARADVQIVSGAELRVHGETTFAGGQYTGEGMLSLDNTAEVVAQTTLECPLCLDPSADLTVPSTQELHLGGGGSIAYGAWIGGEGQLFLHDPEDGALDCDNRVAFHLPVHNGGRIDSPDEACLLYMRNLYDQQATGVWAVDLGGMDNSDHLNPQYDRLAVSGPATLAGCLELSLIDGYTPQLGDYFSILTATTLAGQFDTIDGVLVDDCALIVTYEYDRGIVWVAVGLPGDANRDGVVSDADYTIWADNYGATDGKWRTGDFNGDGVVSDADYTIWADHYGEGGDEVPEPGTFALIAFGVVLLLRRGNSSPGD